MAVLRRNIWSLFFFFTFSGLIFLFYVSYLKWQGINQGYCERQHSIVTLLANTTHSLLVTEEMMLDVLGNELIKDETYKHQVATRRILNDLLKLNPSIGGFGLATPDGHLTLVSSSLDIKKLPNLREQNESKESFEYALKKDKMVLGRTYFMESLNEWVIPMRKSLRDPDGRVLAVMTAGLRVSGASKIFQNKLHFSDFHSVEIIRNLDFYEQFHSSEKVDLYKVYNTPVPASVIDTSLASLAEKYDLTLEQMKASGAAYDYVTKNRQGERVQCVVQYDNRYELWITSQVPVRIIVSDFRKVMMYYTLIFVAVGSIYFLLFRFIATAENQRRDELIHQALHDSLTGLPNRSYLRKAIVDWMRPDGHPFSILYIDMDHFKSVNDSFGHQFGDSVLCELVSRLQRQVGEENLIIRQGGDEFLIITPLIEDEALIVFANSIAAALSSPYRIEHFNVTLGVSIGVAKYPEHGEDLDMLLRGADIAMYESKKIRNSVQLFAPSMQDGYLSRLEIEHHLRNGLDGEELFMVYQPQIDSSGCFYGVESLLRWNSKALGSVRPDHFIPIAEASGLMPQLGNFVLRRTLQDMYELQQILGRTWQVSLNVSVRQFMQAGFLDELKTEIEDVGISKALITLEITENIFIDDIDYILELLAQIHDWGIRISMDDFGTGYSSLSMLRKLPVDELKIDKSFVDTTLNDKTAQKMIRNIIAIGKNLEMSVLAEGVETLSQVAMLKSFDCDYFQGYYYARPLPVEDLNSFLRSWPGS